MPKLKKKRKFSRVRKYQNGGNLEGAPIITQDPGGFQLYRQFRDDGTSYITPTPYNRNYVKISDTGYYPGIPLGLGDASVIEFADDSPYTKLQQEKAQQLLDEGFTEEQIFDDPSSDVYIGRPGDKSIVDKIDSIEGAIERTDAGILGDYAKISEKERDAFEQGVTDGINKAGGTMAALTLGPTSDIYSAFQRYLVNPATSLLTGKKANYNPMGYTQSMLQNLGYADDPGEGFLSTSEALDIENPYGAFVVDAATDPSTILGLGSLIKGGLKNLLKSSVKFTSKRVPITKSIPKLIDFKGGTITRQGDDMVRLGESGGLVTYADEAGNVTYLGFPDASLSSKGLGSRNISYKSIPNRPNTFEIKADLRKGDLANIIDDLAAALPSNHIITETNNISTSGLKFWKDQIKNGRYSPTGQTQTIFLNNADDALKATYPGVQGRFNPARFSSQAEVDAAYAKVMDQIKDIPGASATIKKIDGVRKVVGGLPGPKGPDMYTIEIILPDLQRSFARGGKIKIKKKRKPGMTIKKLDKYKLYL